MNPVPRRDFSRHEAAEFAKQPFEVGVRVDQHEVVFDAEPVKMAHYLAIEVQLEGMGLGIAEEIDVVRSHLLERQDRSVDLPAQRNKVDAPLHARADALDG